MKRNPLNLPETDSRKGQNFDPLKPTFHLDADCILSQNNQLTDHMVKLINDLNKKIIVLNQKYHQVSELEQQKIQIDLDQLQLKLNDYNDHLDYCIKSTQHAMDLKTEFEPKGSLDPLPTQT